MVNIRPAVEQDAPTIKRLVRAEHLDPTSLDWRHFLVAELEGQIVGIGQVKPYPGCHELGSLVVLRPYRGQGIAAQLIAALEARTERPIYLMCAGRWREQYYQRFGYRTISFWRAPRVLRLKLAAVLLFRLFGVRIIAMRKD